MPSPKIAIISSVYNKAPFLDEMIGSLRGQTYTNLEIILVDNASTDDSLAIMRRHQAADERIKVIHLEENRGQSGGLNEAIAHISAPFFTEIDADDWMDCKAIETVINHLDEQTDFLVWRYKEVWSGGESVPMCNFRSEIRNPADTFLLIANLLDQDRTYGGSLIKEVGTPWMKLYRTDIGQRIQHDTSFAFFEDYLWNIKYLSQAKQAQTLNAVLYCLRRGVDSYTTVFSPKKIKELYYATDKIISLVSTLPHQDEVVLASKRFLNRNALLIMYFLMLAGQKDGIILNKLETKAIIQWYNDTKKDAKPPLRERIKVLFFSGHLWWFYRLLSSLIKRGKSERWDGH